MCGESWQPERRLTLHCNALYCKAQPNAKKKRQDGQTMDETTGRAHQVVPQVLVLRAGPRNRHLGPAARVAPMQNKTLGPANPASVMLPSLTGYW